MKEKYVNPFTDFGFKKIFGEEANKDLLIDFLNELLVKNIKTLTFLKTEHLGASSLDRKAIFDLYCENENGEKFIVELQKARQKYFRERSLYYATFALQEQAQVGDWDFRLNTVYSISIMDFVFDETKSNREKFRHEVCLIETETNQVFNDKLIFVYLEMPKFNKTEAELETKFDKWLYILKNLAKIEDEPPKLKERIFRRLFKIAEIAKYNPQERSAYQDSLKYQRDIKNSLDTAKEEEKLEIAAKLKSIGIEISAIIEATGLSREEIENL